MKKTISITAIASISPLGNTLEDIWMNYKNNKHFIVEKDNTFIAELPPFAKAEIESLKASDAKYKSLDDSVLFAIYSARQAVQDANWKASDNFGINIGSSRGATSLFEKYYKGFLKNKKTNTLSSPTTTLGNISSWVAHDLQTQGPEISHSITCSTSLHAILNGIAWIHSGMCNKFLVGGSEAPLTPFTMAQMQALKVYAKHTKINTKKRIDYHAKSACIDDVPNNEESYPCRALDLEKAQNTMILGEGAAMACLELGKTKNALAIILGIGYATEILEHNASLSTNATCFQRSMAMALGDINPNDIDGIVTHTPGTIKGDIAEYNAIKKVFCNKIPPLTTNKWKLGHTLGSSGMLSIEMAVLMLQNQEFISVPFINEKTPKKIKKILVNAVGFGGNAVSILLKKS